MTEHEDRITDEEAMASIIRSGYLLELRLESVFSDHDFHVRMSPAYPDEVTGKSRELDIYAMSALSCGPGDSDFLFPVVLCECINNPQPLVFFGSNSDSVFSDHSKVMLSGVPTMVLDNLPEEDSWSRLSEFLKCDTYHHHCTGPFYTQYCSFQRKRQNQEWMASHNDEHHEIFNTLTMAVESEAREHFENWSFREALDINLQIYYPLVVVQGEILDAEIREGNLTLEPTDHVLYRRDHHSSQRQGTYQIDVITEAYLPDYLETIESLSKTMARRMKRNRVRIRSSVDALQQKGFEKSPWETAREILDFDSPQKEKGTIVTGTAPNID